MDVFFIVMTDDDWNSCFLLKRETCSHTVSVLGVRGSVTAAGCFILR